MAITQKYNPVSGNFDFVGTPSSAEAFILVDGTINPSSTQIVEDVPFDFGNSKAHFQGDGFNPVSFTPFIEAGTFNTTDPEPGGLKHEIGIDTNGMIRFKTSAAGVGTFVGEPNMQFGYFDPNTPNIWMTVDGGSFANAFMDMYHDNLYIGYGYSEYTLYTSTGIDFQTSATSRLTIDTSGNFRYTSTPTIDNALDVTHKGYVDKVSAANTTAKSANYNAVAGDIILMTSGATDKTVTLPAAASNSNAKVIVKKVDSGLGNVIIDGNLAETIDGNPTITITSENDSYTVVCDGSSWHII